MIAIAAIDAQLAEPDVDLRPFGQGHLQTGLVVGRQVDRGLGAPVDQPQVDHGDAPTQGVGVACEVDIPRNGPLPILLAHYLVAESIRLNRAASGRVVLAVRPTPHELGEPTAWLRQSCREAPDVRSGCQDDAVRFRAQGDVSEYPFLQIAEIVGE